MAAEQQPQQRVGGENWTAGFSNVDAAAAPREFVGYLDRATERGQQRKRRSYELLDLRAGHTVLDVGCGAGDDVRALADIVGPTGRAVGVDSSEVMIAEARKRWGDGASPVEYHVRSAYALEFADGSFDGCRAERIFLHLDDPAQALAEMVRVTRTGGRVALVEPDNDAYIVDSPYVEVTRKIVHFRNDRMRNGSVGRQLYRLCKQAGLVEVSVFPELRVVTSFAEADEGHRLREAAYAAAGAGEISAGEAAAWIRYFETAGQRGEFMATLPMFLAVGHKP